MKVYQVSVVNGLLQNSCLHAFLIFVRFVPNMMGLRRRHQEAELTLLDSSMSANVSHVQRNRPIWTSKIIFCPLNSTFQSVQKNVVV